MNRQQCRAARGLLGWSQDDLALAASVSGNVVTAFETGLREPKASTVRQLRATLAVAGAVFVEEADGFGVKLKAFEAAMPVQSSSRSPISAGQSRGARAMLDWTLSEAAAKLGVGKSLLVAFEAGKSHPQASSLEKIQKGFEKAGLRFFEDGDRLAVSFDHRVLNTSGAIP